MTKTNNFTDILMELSSVESVVKNKRDTKVYQRVESRTRKNDFSDALSFEVYDPLWMLTRQWQFGEFQGNDCGSAVTAKIKIKKEKFDSIYLKSGMNSFSSENPLEYDVEKQNRAITPFIRIESALYFKKMIEFELPSYNKELKETLIKKLQTQDYYPLDKFEVADENDLENLKENQNSQLKRYYATYGKRIFDGYKLFLNSDKALTVFKDLQKTKTSSSIKVGLSESGFPPGLVELIDKYKSWFRKKYLPIDNEIDNCWDEEKMGYNIKVGQNTSILEAEDYHTGKLSWYSFDHAGGRKIKASMKIEPEIKYFTYLPTPAHLPGAPNKRLWQFEDASVHIGHQINNDFSMIANAVVMQYVTMYGNDWMIIPLETEVGTILDVEGIIVTDTFGERLLINTPAANNNNGKSYTERWDLFGTSDKYAYTKNDFSSKRGLLFPPTIPRCEESKPLEEIQFLRDEMANMLWGVETVINDKCDGTIQGKDLSDAVLSEIDSLKTEYEMSEIPYDYSYLLQNRVPLNWIPFIPQKIVGEAREIKFRRSRMPIFYNNKYQSVRPSTELLKIKKEGDKVKARFINEEEVSGYGVKLILTAQRTRWFLGKSYTWTGAKKVISQYQANSGLMFDELIENG
ncbi:hypothetical protein LJC25_01115 [Bacteroidales bacterium OttesenSCG-928-K03]|nr:hypothetical protein [Bacteroidales bacterium OttesenSCG-928-K03]